MAKKLPKKHTEPPKRAVCPHCGWDVLWIVYSTVFREAGFRRVTVKCDKCRNLAWYDEKLLPGKIGRIDE